MDGWMDGQTEGWMMDHALNNQNPHKSPPIHSNHRLHEHILKLPLAKTLKWIKYLTQLSQFSQVSYPLSPSPSHWYPKPLAGSSVELSKGIGPNLPKTSWERKSHGWVLAPEHPSVITWFQTDINRQISLSAFFS